VRDDSRRKVRKAGDFRREPDVEGKRIEETGWMIRKTIEPLLDTAEYDRHTTI
jgi:hypothetical protein